VIRKPSVLARRLLASLFLLAACSEGTGPRTSQLEHTSQNSSLLGEVLDAHGIIAGKIPGGFLVNPALRLTPLAADISWSFLAGPLGATSTNDATGLTIVVPPGALSTTEIITVTALAGPAVAMIFV